MRYFLYVEDDPLSREIMRLIVETTLNARLDVFEDSEDFLARVATLSTVPEVVLLDIHVAPLDGFEMLALLRRDPRFADSRIVALTASVMNEEIDRLRGSGFDSAISKPVSIQSFPGLLERILNGELVWHIA